MNVIFISPNYPEGRWRYVNALRGLGVNVLGIGDAVEENFPYGLKGCLTDYYRVDDLHNYDAVYRAVAFFSHKYGRPDVIESLNDYWAVLEASLRRDFNVVGFDLDYAQRVYNRERAEDVIKSSGVKVAAKDCDGNFDVPEGKIIKCCGLANRYGKITGLAVYEFSDVPEMIAEKKELLSFFSTDPGEQFNETVANIVDAVGIKSGFFGFTFAVGEETVLLDWSFLPPDEYFADAMACSGSSDVCHMWAAEKIGMNMDYHQSPDITVYVTRRFDRSYRYSHDRVMTKLRSGLRRYGRSYTGVDITGDYFYIFKADSEQKARNMIEFIQMDYSDISPIAQFPPLRAVKKEDLKQTSIREQSSFDARRLISRKVEEKMRQGEAVQIAESAYEQGKAQAGLCSDKAQAQSPAKTKAKKNPPRSN